jgi:RNA polymerase sigma-70 factor, ECF subfamily
VVPALAGRSRARDNLGGWLTTVVGRVCLDMLRSRRARREECVGSWLPEPVVTTDESASPEDDALIADSVGLALLVVLETLTPPSGSPSSSTTCSRPVRRDRCDRGAKPRRGPAARKPRTPARPRAPLNEHVGVAEQRELVDAFLAASRSGDFEALVAVLDPDVVFRADTGPGSRLARGPVEGAEPVARRVLARGRSLAGLARPALVNGGAGLVVGRPGRPIAVVSFTVAGGRIVAIDLVTDREKLARLESR